MKFVALAPDSGFHFPRSFDLAHTDGYYKGIVYGQLYHKRQAPKVGGS